MGKPKKKSSPSKGCSRKACRGCVTCEDKPAITLSLGHRDETGDKTVNIMESVDPKYVSQSVSTLFILPDPAASGVFAKACKYVAEDLKNALGIRCEENQDLIPLPVARLASPQGLWDPAPRHGHPRQVRASRWSPMTRGKVGFTSLRLRMDSEGNARVKATVSIREEISQAVKEWFLFDREFQWLNGITLVYIKTPFNKGALKSWSEVFLPGTEFWSVVGVEDMWLLEHQSYLRPVYSQKEVVLAPYELFKEIRNCDHSVPNLSLEQLLLMGSQRLTIMEESLKDERSKAEDEDSTDEIWIDSDDESYTEAPWTVQRRRRAKQDSQGDSRTPGLPSCLHANSLSELGASFQNYKLRNQAAPAKSIGQASLDQKVEEKRSYSEAVQRPRESKAQEAQERSIMIANNFLPKAMTSKTPQKVAGQEAQSQEEKGKSMEELLKEAKIDRSTAKALIKMGNPNHVNNNDPTTPGKSVSFRGVANSTEAVDQGEDDKASTVSSSCPSVYRECLDKLFPRVKDLQLRLTSVGQDKDLLVPSSVCKRPVAATLPQGFSDLLITSNMSKEGKRLHKALMEKHDKEVNNNLAEEENKVQEQILNSSQRMHGVLTGHEASGEAKFENLSASAALNFMLKSGRPLVFASGRQVSAMAGLLENLRKSLYTLDQTQMDPEGKAELRAHMGKSAGQLLTRMAEDELLRVSSKSAEGDTIEQETPEEIDMDQEEDKTDQTKEVKANLQEKVEKAVPAQTGKPTGTKNKVKSPGIIKKIGTKRTSADQPPVLTPEPKIKMTRGAEGTSLASPAPTYESMGSRSSTPATDMGRRDSRPSSESEEESKSDSQEEEDSKREGDLHFETAKNNSTLGVTSLFGGMKMADGKSEAVPEEIEDGQSVTDSVTDPNIIEPSSTQLGNALDQELGDYANLRLPEILPRLSSQAQDIVSQAVSEAGLNSDPPMEVDSKNEAEAKTEDKTEAGTEVQTEDHTPSRRTTRSEQRKLFRDTPAKANMLNHLKNSQRAGKVEPGMNDTLADQESDDEVGLETLITTE